MEKMTEFAKAKAKAKAEELILKFMRLQERNYNWFHSELAKKCALIAVDEILKVFYDANDTDFEEYGYWIDVKEEIDKL